MGEDINLFLIKPGDGGQGRRYRAEPASGKLLLDLTLVTYDNYQHILEPRSAFMYSFFR